jgi:hypothetical protein
MMGGGKGRSRSRRRPSYECTIVCDFDVLVEIQDRAALGEAQGCWPDGRDRAEGEEKKGKTVK